MDNDAAEGMEDATHPRIASRRLLGIAVGFYKHSLISNCTISPPVSMPSSEISGEIDTEPRGEHIGRQCTGVRLISLSPFHTCVTLKSRAIRIPGQLYDVANGY